MDGFSSAIRFKSISLIGIGSRSDSGPASAFTNRSRVSDQFKLHANCCYGRKRVKPKSKQITIQVKGIYIIGPIIVSYPRINYGKVQSSKTNSRWGFIYLRGKTVTGLLWLLWFTCYGMKMVFEIYKTNLIQNQSVLDSIVEN